MQALEYAMKKTMYEKIWDSHLVVDEAGQAPLLYVDRHLMHEVTSPQAFEGLRLSGRKVRNPHSILATMDHCVPTKNRDLPIADPIAKKQIETMAENCRVNGLNLYDMKNPNNGVIHVVVPEHGFVHPGMVVVCGDSHTATHGAFGALGVRYRHVRGRACDGDPNVAAEKIQNHAGSGQWRIIQIRFCERYCAGDYRQNRHRGRHRLCDRIYRRGDQGTVDGRPHDAVQHGD